jgi:hypothetical protein
MSFKPVLLHFKFHNFASLSTEVGSIVNTEVQSDCNGNKWKLQLYHEGHRINTEESCVGLYLCSCNAKKIEAKYSFFIIHERGVRAEKTFTNVFNLDMNMNLTYLLSIRGGLQ